MQGLREPTLLDGLDEHSLTLLEPEEVVPAWKRWTPTLLRPDGLYGTKPATGGNKPAKLKAIRDAMAVAA